MISQNSKVKIQNKGKAIICIKYIIFAFCIFNFTFLFGCAPKKETSLEKVKVTRGNILAQLPTTGVVIPRNRLEIKPPVAGRIDSILVNEGDYVRKGQIIAWMSSLDRATLIDAARAKGEAEVKRWEEMIKATPVIAPINGFIIQRTAEPGQTLTSSDIVQVMADKLIVQGQVDETDIGRIKVGQQAMIVLDAFADQPIPGRVEQIAYESETINNVTVYKVNILPNNVPSFFRSGMSATVNFTMDERKNVLELPLTAIRKKSGRSYVFKQNGSVKALQVQTGLENTSKVEIVSGLVEGEEVVIPTQTMATELLATSGHRPPSLNFLGGNKKK
ncbi:MAG: HlyD family efflux transporter periplasmic adaptor subunit [Candidatus Margulisbacteria bacterium]|nr:HlyD family efflux transporter periplasmic adaptor subunit [Candidatus Margulisiibacteriota bacterium]